MTTVEILKEMAFTATETQRRALEDAISALENKGDLISRQAVLEVVRKWFDKIQLNGDICLDGIVSLPSAENKDEWIPVSERLPENNDDVLVYDNSDIFVAWYSGIDGNWCSTDNRFDEYTPIIAWQPLPDPYKAEKPETCKGCLEPCIMYEPDMRGCKNKVTERGE